MKSNSRKYVLLVVIVVVALVVDQWTKHLIQMKFLWGQSLTVWDPIFALTYVRNTGAAFGLMHRAPIWFREPFFIIVPVVALFIISFLYYRLDDSQWEAATALSLIVGGAVGNLIDRLRFGYVVDFLDVHWKEIYHWPAFNVADSCIVVGVSLMMLLSFSQKPSSTASTAQSPAPLP